MSVEKIHKNTLLGIDKYRHAASTGDNTIYKVARLGDSSDDYTLPGFVVRANDGYVVNANERRDEMSQGQLFANRESAERMMEQTGGRIIPVNGYVENGRRRLFQKGWVVYDASSGMFYRQPHGFNTEVLNEASFFTEVTEEVARRVASLRPDRHMISAVWRSPQNYVLLQELPERQEPSTESDEVHVVRATDTQGNHQYIMQIRNGEMSLVNQPFDAEVFSNAAAAREAIESVNEDTRRLFYTLRAIPASELGASTEPEDSDLHNASYRTLYEDTWQEVTGDHNNMNVIMNAWFSDKPLQMHVIGGDEPFFSEPVMDNWDHIDLQKRGDEWFVMDDNENVYTIMDATLSGPQATEYLDIEVAEPVSATEADRTMRSSDNIEFTDHEAWYRSRTEPAAEESSTERASLPTGWIRRWVLKNRSNQYLHEDGEFRTDLQDAELYLDPPTSSASLRNATIVLVAEHPDTGRISLIEDIPTESATDGVDNGFVIKTQGPTETSYWDGFYHNWATELNQFSFIQPNNVAAELRRVRSTDSPNSYALYRATRTGNEVRIGEDVPFPDWEETSTEEPPTDFLIGGDGAVDINEILQTLRTEPVTEIHLQYAGGLKRVPRSACSIFRWNSQWFLRTGSGDREDMFRIIDVNGEVGDNALNLGRGELLPSPTEARQKYNNADTIIIPSAPPVLLRGTHVEGGEPETEPLEGNIPWRQIRERFGERLTEGLNRFYNHAAGGTIQSSGTVPDPIDALSFGITSNGILLNFRTRRVSEMQATPTGSTGAEGGTESVSANQDKHVILDQSDNVSVDPRTNSVHIFTDKDISTGTSTAAPELYNIAIQRSLREQRTEQLPGKATKIMHLIDAARGSKAINIPIGNQTVEVTPIDILIHNGHYYMIATSAAVFDGKDFMMQLNLSNSGKPTITEDAFQEARSIGEFGIAGGQPWLRTGPFESERLGKEVAENKLPAKPGDKVNKDGKFWIAREFRSPYYLLLEHGSDREYFLSAECVPLVKTHSFSVGQPIISTGTRSSEDIRNKDVFIVLDESPTESDADATIGLALRLEGGQYVAFSEAEIRSSARDIFFHDDFETVTPDAFSRAYKQALERAKQARELDKNALYLGDKQYKYCGFTTFGSTVYTVLEDEGERKLVPSSYISAAKSHSGTIRKIAGKGLKKDAAVYYPIDDELEMKISKLSHEMTGEGWFTYAQCQDVKAECVRSGYTNITNLLHLEGIKGVIRRYLAAGGLNKAASSR